MNSTFDVLDHDRNGLLKARVATGHFFFGVAPVFFVFFFFGGGGVEDPHKWRKGFFGGFQKGCTLPATLPRHLWGGPWISFLLEGPGFSGCHGNVGERLLSKDMPIYLTCFPQQM